MSVTVTTDALAALSDYIEKLPDESRTAARIALNDVASGKGLKLLKQMISSQVDFPNGYLSNDRIGVKSKATNQNLQTVIAARMRPTSLARFAPGAALKQRGGVTVTVKPGAPSVMLGAFLMRLKSGTELTDSNFNLGLAMRLKPGQSMSKYKRSAPVEIADNLYLLYGPSVDQVFSDVADDAAPEIADMIDDEFTAQFARLTNE